MKKVYKMLAVALMTIMCIGLTACSNRTPVSVSDFNEIMEEKGFEIVDATGQVAPESITAISIAVNEDYQIELYEMVSDATATAVFAENKDIFEDYAIGSATTISKNIMNYAYYSVTSSGTYYALSKIGNTMIYVVADAEYKDEISEILKELGY